MAAAKQNYRVRSKLEVFYTGGAARLSADGKLLACACADEVKVVEVATGAVLKTFAGDSEPVTALALSPDGRLLFAASRSLQLRCWSLESGQVLRSYKGHRAPIADMAVDASSGLLATSSADRTVRVWDIDGGFCTHSFAGHSGVVLRVLFHPKQLMLVSAGDDAEVRVWDLVTRSCSAVLKGHFSAVTSLSLSPDGWTLLSGGRDSVVIVWNMRDYSKLATVPVYEALEGVAYLPSQTPFPGLPGSGVAAAAGGKAAAKAAPVLFATGGERGVVRLWRADTAKCVYEQPPSMAVASSSAGGIVELALLPGEAGVLTATRDCRLLFHRPAGSDLAVDRQLIGNNDEVTDMRFVALGNASSGGGSGSGEGGGGRGDEQHTGAAAAPVVNTHLAVSTNSDQIRLFDVSTMSCTATLIGHTDTVLALDALRLPSGDTLLASGAKDASVRLWSLPAGRCVGVGAGHVSSVSCVAFARRSRSFAATGGADKLLKVWDIAKLALDADSPASLRVVAAVAAHDKDINAVAVAPNDSVICTGSQDRTARIWKLPDLVLSLTLKGHKRGIWAVAFSPVDQAIATASGDKTVRLWSLTDGACLRTFEGHTASVLRLDFLSAGTQILSAGADGLIKLWSVRMSECINTFDAHEDKVWALALSGPAGDVLASGGGDGTIAIWEDCTVADADDAASIAEQAVVKEQDLANALKEEDYGKAAALAFEMRHPGRLLAVARQALERGQRGDGDILGRLAAGMSPDDLRQCLDYCRDWNANGKNCQVAQAMVRAVLRQRQPQELLAVPGLAGVLEGLLPYTQRHFARADRLLRSTFLCEYILGAMQVLSPEDQGQGAGSRGGVEEAAAAAAGSRQQTGGAAAPAAAPQQRRQRPIRALLGGARAAHAPAAALAKSLAQQEQQRGAAATMGDANGHAEQQHANGHTVAAAAVAAPEVPPEVEQQQQDQQQDQLQQQHTDMDSQQQHEAAETPKPRKKAAKHSKTAEPEQKPVPATASKAVAAASKSKKKRRISA